MPMTNVGKIFKPDLRALATRAVIEELARQCATEAGLAQAPALHIEQTAEGWRVAPANGEAPEAWGQALATALERLPVKVRWQG